MYGMAVNSISVLLVEDEASMREVVGIQIIICCPNARIIAFDSAYEASVYLRSPESLDLAVIDFFTRDHLDGYDLALLIREKFPKLPIISMSGSDPDEIFRLQKLISMERVHFISKPFSTNQLDELVKAIFR